VVQYRRNLVPGATYFFTVTLRDRKVDFLVRHIPLLREAFRSVRGQQPFMIDAIVILPDHLAFGRCRLETRIIRIAGVESRRNTHAS
jgi:REP element-mobilizing transposase RayT